MDTVLDYNISANGRIEENGESFVRGLSSLIEMPMDDDDDKKCYSL